ncbi:protein unusual floral organs [Nicotiana attenuata]|uniref:Protein unusual floral organs n=2 Tax=Nicotiana attenuata TaxID=49451 RepID=A0A1J6JXA6_NICAT|nr:protein unusual floral organs [Nicotiana attenuata]
MWSNLPFDILANIFYYLSPDSLARAKSACKNWHTCAKNSASPRRHHPPWFVALPTRITGHFCYGHNPIDDSWHLLPLDFIPNPIRPIAAIGGLILLRQATTTALQLAICNPFTRQFRQFPKLNVTRTNPAVGVIELNSVNFKVYVAGGMSEASTINGGGASYEPTLEVYDSVYNKWKTIGSMPMEFAVRLTVWTPNESVYCNGVLYWITSARAYTIMVYEIEKNKWRELSVPMADRLEFAALVQRNGKLSLVGGTCDAGACIWELSEDNNWIMIEKVAQELGARLLEGKGRWGSINTKCVCTGDAMCLYRDLESGMVVWRECVKNGKWEWHWIEGCGSIKGMKLQNFPIKGLLLHPYLAFSSVLNQ